MSTEKELNKDNLRETHWLGEVVENNDPKGLGRCRVKIYGKFDNLPNEAIPWATPMNRDHVGAHHIPRIGDIVAARFDNGNIYHPEYWFYINQNKDLKNDVLDVSGEPHNVISIVYDAERNVRIYYSPEDGLVMTTGVNKDTQPMIRFSNNGEIFIHSDNIFIASSKNDTGEPAVKGQTLADLLNDIVEKFKTHTHTSGMGPIMPSMAIELSLTQKTKIGAIKQVK